MRLSLPQLTKANDDEDVVDSGVCGDNLTWKLDSEGVLTISGTGDMYDYENLASGGFYQSSAPWWSYLDSITEIVIDEGATSIGNYAFMFLDSVTNITIPSSVRTIGDYAFYFCDSLTSVTLPEGVESIGDYAFYGWYTLSEVVIPSTVKVIGAGALPRVDGYLYIYNGTMSEWNQISIDKTTPSATLSDTIENWTLLAKVIYCTDGVVGGCGLDYCLTWTLNNEGMLTISGSGDMGSATESGVYTSSRWCQYFSDSVTNIVIETSVTNICDGAFSACSNATTVTIPNDVTEVGGYAFYNCSSLTDVYYDGTEEEWNEISILTGNDYLLSATIHFKHTHSLEKTEAVDATCTEDGNIEYWYCSGCDTYFSDEDATTEITLEDTIKEATGHDYEAVVTEPTCTEGGYTTYTCSVCGDTYTADETEATGHNYVATETSATCTEGGYTTYVCSECGDTYTDSETEALGHDYESEVTKEPTCTETGVMTYTCTRCDDSYTEEIDMVDHTEGETVVENEVAATCTEDGSYDTVVYCTVCGEELSRETITVSATGHTTETQNAKDATCTEEGYTGDEVCTVCGETITTGEVIPATGHYYIPYFTWADDYSSATAKFTCRDCDYEETFDAVITSKITSATCTEDGEIIYFATVTLDGDIYQNGVTEVISATGHSYEAVVTEPTCTEGGYTTYTCSNCGDSYVADETAALGHNYEEAVTEPTCTEGGYTTHTCSVCGDTYTDSETEALGHNYESEVTTEATCTEAGVRTYTCSRCGDTYTEEIPATGHNYVPTETTATCTDGGYTTYVCSECGDTYTDEETEALGHDYESVVTKEPTCTETGVMTYTCSRCGDSYTEEIDMIDHTYGEPEWTWTWSETEQTYNVTAKFTCTVCGETDTETALVTSETTDATCTATGSTVYTAVVDMDGTAYSGTKTVELPMIPHTEGEAVTENEVAATCTTGGSYDTVVYCSVCGEELSRETVTVPATGHTEGEAVTENEVAATCTTDGSYDTVVYCTVCGEELSRETITVPATGHTTEIQNAKDATCTEDGYTGDEVCTVCGETVTVGTVIPATGHSFNSDGVCEACGAKTGESDTTSTVTVESDDTIFANVLPSGLVTSTTISISNDNSGTLVVSTVVEVSAYPYLVEHIADTLSFTLYNESQGDDLISDTNSFTITTTENNKKTLKKVTILFYGDVDYSGTGTSTVTMDFASASDLSSSDIYVLHYTGSYPTWEVVASTVTFGEAITVEFEASDYSPFVVLSVASASSGGSSSALDILLRISANYSEVNEAITRANALNPADYVDFSAVTEAINAVNWNLKAINQLTVNAYADAINTAIDSLVETTATITEETVNIAEPIEDTNTDTEDDDDESSETSEPESNPTTGIAISLLPMMIAALAAVSAKRR